MEEFIESEISLAIEQQKSDILRVIEGKKKKEGLIVIGFDGKTGKTEITQEGWDKGAKHYQIIGYNSALDEIYKEIEEKI